MHVTNNFPNISYFKIESSEDVNDLINSSEHVKEKINYNLSFYGIHLEGIPEKLLVGDFYENIFTNSLGLSKIDVISEMDEYQTLLTDTVDRCDRRLLPIIIRALNCHQLAFNCFSTDQQFGVKLMSETEELGDYVSNESKNISDNFEQLSKKMSAIVSDLSRAKYKIDYKKGKIQLNAATLTKGDEKILSLLDNQIVLLEGAIKSSSACFSASLTVMFLLRKVELFFNKLDLADPDLVEFMAEEELSNQPSHQSQFIQDLQTQEKIIAYQYEHKKKMEQILDVNDVVNNMKSGQQENTYIPTPFSDYISEQGNGIFQKLENSTLNWLTVAKINLVIVKNMRDAVDSLIIYKYSILQTANDPLVKALQSLSI